MTKITLYHVVGYTAGLALSALGSIMLIMTLWKAWPAVADSSDILTALQTYLWTNELNFGYNIKLKLMEVAILGTIILIIGITTTILSRQVYHRGRYVLLQCPFCKNRWKAERARTWATCPYCNKHIQPQQ